MITLAEISSELEDISEAAWIASLAKGHIEHGPDQDIEILHETFLSGWYAGFTVALFGSAQYSNETIKE